MNEIYFKIRNKQINKVNYKKEKRNTNIKYNIFIKTN